MWDTLGTIIDIITSCFSVNTSGCNMCLINVELRAIYTRVGATMDVG